MITTQNDKFNKKVRTSNYLQDSRNAGGAAVGCIAGGIVLLVVGGLLAILLIIAGEVLVGLGICVPGLLLTFGGVHAKNKRKKNYVSFYTEQTGYSEAEIRQLEEELKDPSIIVTSYKPKEGTQKGVSIGCVITKNYFLMPMIGYVYARKIEDMVAMAYSESIPGVDGYRYGLIFFASQDKDVYNQCLMKKQDCMEVLNLLLQRNQNIFTSHAFLYENKKYNLIENRQEVIELHKKLCKK